MLHKVKLLKRQKIIDAFWAWVGSSTCMACIALLDHYFFEIYNIDLLMASFGASAVLVFGVPASPLAQPRNVLGGHFVSALAGVSCQIFLSSSPIVAACTAVSLAIFLMTLTKTLHPPGGASALLAVVGDQSIHDLGYLYAVTPCLLGASLVVSIGVAFSYATRQKNYPTKWW